MAKTRYVWSSVSDNVLQEKDGNTGATQVTYTNEPAPYGPLRSERRDTETRQYHFDALGSTRALTDDSQTVTDTFAYDAWGKGVVHTGATPSSYSWLGQWGYRHDLAAEAYYVRPRSYSPESAHWSSQDSLLFHTIPNRYAYAFNQPVTQIDPTGHASSPLPPAGPCCCHKEPTIYIRWGCIISPVLYCGKEVCVPASPGNPCNAVNVHCGSEYHGGWQKKCDPTNACGRRNAPPLKPPAGNPSPGDPCYYPGRQVNPGNGGVYESQCVCQCAGDSPTFNCIRACIQCSHDSGAPINIDAEQMCRAQCGPQTPAELARMDCCINRDWNRGGCAGLGFLPPHVNPNPDNPTCTNMPIP